MGRFNETVEGRDVTKNYEGAKAHKLTSELELYTAVCCASLQSKFYCSAEDQVDQIRSLIKKVDATFVEKLAVYAREQMYLRSVPLVLCVELARIGKLSKETVTRVIQRADEIVELLAYYQAANDRDDVKKLKKLSKAIQKGIKKVFEDGKFKEYHFGKYNRKTDVKFRDALFLTHPKPRSEEQEKLFKKIAEDTLEVPYTWEVELSKIGQEKYDTEEDRQIAFRSKWEELIDSGKVGYMAMLRNLRNILKAEVSSKHIEKVCLALSDPEAVKGSRQFPFRFLSAYKILSEDVSSEYASYVQETLEKAIQISVENIEGFGVDSKVLIACDTSGSMSCTISDRSFITYQDVGLVLGMLLQSKCKLVTIGIFGEDWKTIQLPRTNILQNVETLDKYSGVVGHSTNGWKVLDWAVKNKKTYDKVMIFTDMQLWDSTSYFDGTSHEMIGLWNKYKQLNPEAKLYIFDLAGYGTSPLDIRQRDVYLIAGWSEKVFDVLGKIEKGQEVIDIIKSN